LEKPLVSIVVVSYNHAHFLEENLNSIKAQTYPSIQLIVADDASKDNSIEVYENWLEKNNYPPLRIFIQKTQD
jgi:alpha-1,3-rhamnosyltransferase